jgi:hypothetical protein
MTWRFWNRSILRRRRPEQIAAPEDQLGGTRDESGLGRDANPPAAPPRQWKWYFAANLNAFKHAFDQIQAAVISAGRETTLKPICLVDDHRDLSEVADRLAWLEQMGVALMPHKAELFGIVRQHFGPQADVFSGHWLRCDIPILESEDDFVLYTDIDIVFRKPIDFGSLAPACLACAPEHRQDDFDYFNSGVMVMNVPALRATRGTLIDVLRDRLNTMPAHDDQGALNVAYRHGWTRLPNRYNWKPYWGYSDDAAIVHFHGPKPGVIRRMLGGEMDLFDAELQEIFHRDPQSFSKYLAEFDAVLQANPIPQAAAAAPDRR